MPVQRDKNEKRRRRTIEEQLRKYEVRAEGYEFIPALMHTLGRYVEDERKNRSDVDAFVARALDGIPEARGILGRALEAHHEIPRELSSRVFSARYLDLSLRESITSAELGSILERAQILKNRSVTAIPSLAAHVRHLAHAPGVHGHEPSGSGGCCCEPPMAPSEPQPPPPPRNHYEVAFSKLYCVDESDPEWAGSDEPYVVFAVLTEEMADNGTAAIGSHSPIYGDVDDGDTRPDSGDENLRLFGFTGPRAIDSSVLITATCFEHDLGDPTETTEAVRTALTAVAAKAAAAGGTVGWIVAGVAVVAIGVTYLIDLIGADDAIGGSLALTLTQAQADALTASVNPHLFAPLHFDGGDGDGIYDAYLKLTRV